MKPGLRSIKILIVIVETYCDRQILICVIIVKDITDIDNLKNDC